MVDLELVFQGEILLTHKKIQGPEKHCVHVYTLYFKKRCSTTANLNTFQLSAPTDDVLQQVEVGIVLTEGQDFQFVYLPGEEDSLWQFMTR